MELFSIVIEFNFFSEHVWYELHVVEFLLLYRQKKLHLQTLQAWSDTQKTTPRERMWLRKLQAAEERARRLK